MQLYQHENRSLCSLKEKPFKLEKEIQTLFEKNLDQITNYKLIKSEFIIKNSRIDTLAFDQESKAFVIIEYKRERNDGVVDQGLSYLNLMLEYKSDFIVEYNESCNKNLKRTDVDWSQSKILFVAPSFNNYQKQSSNFKDLPIELWEIKRFENDIILINPIKKSQAAPSFKEVQNYSDKISLHKIVTEIKVYTEDDHLEGKSDYIKELYESFKSAILALSSDIEIEFNKYYIAFKKSRNIVDIHIQQKGLKMWINLKKGELDDSKKLATDISGKGHWGNGDYQLNISDTKDLEYLMSLVKQSLYW